MQKVTVFFLCLCFRMVSFFGGGGGGGGGSKKLESCPDWSSLGV